MFVRSPRVIHNFPESWFDPKMGDFDSGIGIDSGITLSFSHFGIGFGIKLLRNAGIGIKIALNWNQPKNGIDSTRNQVYSTEWNRNRSRNQRFYWNRNRNRNRDYARIAHLWFDHFHVYEGQFVRDSQLARQAANTDWQADNHDRLLITHYLFWGVSDGRTD